MKKWKIKGSYEFQDLLAKLESDDKILNDHDYDGDSSCLFYGIEDGVLTTWDLDNSEHFSHEEITVEELEQLYYPTSTIKKWSVGTYVVFCKDFTSVCPIGFVDKIITGLDAMGCVHLEKYLTLDIRRENDNKVKWFATKQEAEDFAKTLTTVTDMEDFKIGDWIVSLTDKTNYRKIGDVFQIVKFGTSQHMIYYTPNTWGDASTFRRALSHEIPTIPVDEPLKSKYLIAAEKAMQHFRDAGFYVGCEYESTKGTIYKSMCELTIYSKDSKDCNIDCGGGFLWEYERNGQTDVYGKLLIEDKPMEDKPQSMEREFQVGDRVECVNEYAHISVGMHGVIVEVSSVNIGVSWDTLTKGHGCNGNCAVGTGYYIMRDNVRLIGTSFPNIPTSQELNTYGLQIGDTLDVNVLNAWTIIEGNRSTDDKTEWHRGGGMFIGNRVIKSFHLIHGHVGFEVSDTSNIYLKAEGFKEFADSYYSKKVNSSTPQGMGTSLDKKHTHPYYGGTARIDRLEYQYNILMHQREQLIQKESNQTQELLTLPTNKIYVRKSKSIK